MKFDERNPIFFKSLLFLAYLVPLDVDVTGNITAKICEVWGEFNIFCTLVAILNFLNPQKLSHTMVDIPPNLMKFDERNPNFF